MNQTHLFIDTNIFIRHIINDQPRQHEACANLIMAIESGNFTPYTSSIVILEIHYVLTKLYHQPSSIVNQAVNATLSLPRLQFIETTDTPKAQSFFEKYGVKYSDCLIATQIPNNCHLVTYDQDFDKFPNLKVLTPAELKF